MELIQSVVGINQHDRNKAKIYIQLSLSPSNSLDELLVNMFLIHCYDSKGRFSYVEVSDTRI